MVVSNQRRNCIERPIKYQQGCYWSRAIVVLNILFLIHLKQLFEPFLEAIGDFFWKVTHATFLIVYLDDVK
jgi:hypothetical protein